MFTFFRRVFREVCFNRAKILKYVYIWKIADIKHQNLLRF